MQHHPRTDTLTTSYGSWSTATVLVEHLTDEGMTRIGQTAVAPRSYGETAEGILNVANIGAIFEAAGLTLSIAIYYDLIAVAAAHLAAALPRVTGPRPSPTCRTPLLTEPFEPQGLSLPAPTDPGFGVAFGPAKVRTYTIVAHTYR